MHPIEILQTTATLLRTAINDTLNSLEGLDSEDRSAVMLVAHLSDLLAAEKKLLCETSQSTPTEKPWYPDGSGSWVETHGVDPELSDRLRVQILAEIERDRKMHIPTAFLPSVVNWPRIVAYKVVSP